MSEIQPDGRLSEPSEDLKVAAHNLLSNCAGLKSGDRLLILRESSVFGFYDDKAPSFIAEAALEYGILPTVEQVPFVEEADNLPPEITALMDAADCTLFFARLGDQIRFRDLRQKSNLIVSYVLDEDMLASGFGRADYKAFVGLKQAIDGMISGAEDIRVTCPSGTDFKGSMKAPVQPAGSDVTITRFPMSVFAPVPSDGFSGRVALPHFLTGTGSNYYHPYTVEFENVVFASFEDSRLTGFEGGSEDVAKANEHYDFVSQKFGIDRNFVHSWHVGIHPGCAYARAANLNYERWSGAAFGNPRILHFHTCGAYPPGEISWNIVDPTVLVDGTAVWERGRLFPERIPGGRELLETYPCAASVFADPAQEIGL